MSAFLLNAPWKNSYLLLIVPGFALYWCFLMWMVSVIGGWRLLAGKFRATSPFSGEQWRWQAAQFRFTAHYNGVLTVGADPMRLYLAIMPLFAFAHPPLLIPWHEIPGWRRRQFLFLKQVELQLGRERPVGMRINERLALKIQAAAGASWPKEIVG